MGTPLSAPNRGLFVDLDGTLANSLGVMRAVYRRFLGHFDKEATDTEFSELNGPPLFEVVARLRQSHGLGEPHDQLMALYDRLVDEAYEAVSPNPGAPELLRAAGDAGFKVGVVTSNSTRRTDRWLRRVSLRGMIDVMVAAEDVVRGKPQPEPYRAALAKADCQLAGSLAVEDSPAGVRSALSAGLRTFMLSTDELKPVEGAILVGHLDEVTRHLVGGG